MFLISQGDPEFTAEDVRADIGLAPIHTRFDAVEWFVWDAEHALSTMNRAEVIRQSETLEEALRGL